VLIFPGAGIYCFEVEYVFMTTMTATGNGGKMLSVLIKNCNPSLEQSA
jgi:hypothetical protein